MPEGPELKLACDNLNQLLKDSEITDIKILSGRYYPEDRNPDDFDNLKQLLPLKIKEINVKGKLLYFILENNWVILNTFGMSGRWTKHMSKHCHIELTYNNDSSIWFCDTRRFGTIKILKNIDLLDKKLRSLGPDMLNSDIDQEEFIKILNKHKNKNITKVLMNQSIVSGIGNYIKSESLYRAGISPYNKVDQISTDKLNLLYNEIRKVMRESYQSQGATISTYLNIDDQKGGYSFEFKVYMKDIDEHGYKIIREKTEDGRTSHWVKELQS